MYSTVVYSFHASWMGDVWKVSSGKHNFFFKIYLQMGLKRKMKSEQKF
jgi:hypothetical protein